MPTPYSNAAEYHPTAHISEQVGKEKVAGKRPAYGPGLPTKEAALPLHVMSKAEVHEMVKEIIETSLKNLWYDAPKLKFYPFSFSPQATGQVASVFNLRYEDRIYSSMWVAAQTKFQLNIPGISQVQFTFNAGWNTINLPEGTQMFLDPTVTSNTPVLFRFSNKPIETV